MFPDHPDDQQSGHRFKRGVFWEREAVQTRALAAEEKLHQSVRTRAVWDRKEDVHRPAARWATDPAQSVLGTTAGHQELKQYF